MYYEYYDCWTSVSNNVAMTSIFNCSLTNLITFIKQNVN